MPNRLKLFAELDAILDADGPGIIILYKRAGDVEHYHVVDDPRIVDLTGDLILHHQFGVLKSYNVSDRRKAEEQRTPGEERRRHEG